MESMEGPTNSQQIKRNIPSTSSTENASHSAHLISHSLVVGHTSFSRRRKGRWLGSTGIGQWLKTNLSSPLQGAHWREPCQLQGEESTLPGNFLCFMHPDDDIAKLGSQAMAISRGLEQCFDMEINPCRLPCSPT